MYEIEMDEMTEGFFPCWKAAGMHLSSKVDGGIQSWLRAHYWNAPGSSSRVYGGGFQYKARQAQLRTLEVIDSQQHSYDYTARQTYRGIYGSAFPS
jgi:hypothetical protein